MTMTTEQALAELARRAALATLAPDAGDGFAQAVCLVARHPGRWRAEGPTAARLVSPLADDDTEYASAARLTWSTREGVLVLHCSVYGGGPLSLVWSEDGTTTEL